ncbi:VOC family protein [Bacillus solimangrovi]|uniref:Glyoxalase n=1 Tax=Bacillus solimangrovi TaxID=1305675 RepID=A0A1E5LHL6_9BACI|nr:VOC family protein [Bacillus solimangrovi]OEH93546.1 glyoxalase [Bacillus solimangrovi]
MIPIIKQISTIFIPVSDIEKARDWYCDLLGLPSDGEILFEHLYILSMDGTNIVLDNKIYSEDNIFKTPLFHFNTKNINDAFEYVKSKKIEITTNIENGHWFNFKDRDGNILMICQC